MKDKNKKQRQKREFHWTNFKNPLPETEKEREVWIQRMQEDSNRTLLPKYQH